MPAQSTSHDPPPVWHTPHAAPSTSTAPVDAASTSTAPGDAPSTSTAPHAAPSTQPDPPSDPARPPRVAVVIPCYNDGALVPDAVASAQSADDVELVVVDDGSTEPGTLAVLDEFARRGVTVLHQANAGLSAARMAGVRATSAPYVFDLDADDLAVADALPRMADLLDADPDAAVCYGDYEEFGDSRLVRLVPRWIDPYRLAYTNEYPVTALFRRTALEAVGGWRHLGAGYEDWGLWMGLAEHGYRGVYAGPGVLTMRRRLHGERMLGAAKAEHPALYRALREEHPRLFAELAAHRRASDMPPLRKRLYPLLYGGRRRFRFERHIKGLLDRAGVWTLRG